jgi:hypothetical protein
MHCNWVRSYNVEISRGKFPGKTAWGVGNDRDRVGSDSSALYYKLNRGSKNAGVLARGKHEIETNRVEKEEDL